MGKFHYIIYIDKNNNGKYDIRTEIENIDVKNRAPGISKKNFDTLNEAFMSISGTIEGNDRIECTTVKINHANAETSYKCAIYKKGLLWRGWVNEELVVSTPFRRLTLFMIKRYVKNLKRSVYFTL